MTTNREPTTVRSEDLATAEAALHTRYVWAINSAVDAGHEDVADELAGTYAKEAYAAAR